MLTALFLSPYNTSEVITMTPGKQSSEYGVSKASGLAAVVTALLATLIEAGVIAPGTEMSWPIAAIIMTAMMSGAIVVAAYSISRGLAKNEFRPRQDTPPK
jgi:hypothetical protein